MGQVILLLLLGSTLASSAGVWKSQPLVVLKKLFLLSFIKRLLIILVVQLPI